MVGIYARTDIERGVHKAPANEVVRGIIGLQRRLNKSEHDILNPYPVNINVSNSPSATTSAETHSKQKNTTATRISPSSSAISKVTRGF